MARKRLLTWRKADGRYMKIVEGRAYYFGRGKSIDDTKAYREAEQKYLDFLSNRAKSAPVTVPLSTASVTHIAERYVQHLEERCSRQDVSLSYFIRARTSLNEFVAAIGPTRRFGEIGELDLEDYRTHVLRLPASRHTARSISLATAKNRLDSVKALYRWGYKTRLVNEQPRNLLDYTRFAIPQPVVKVFTIEEVHCLWVAASERVRAYIALGLNCGFGQADVAALRAKQVDLETGYIQHSRVKTGVEARYKLWPVTAALLARFKQQAAAPNDRWFLGDRGEPLVHESLKDGKLKRTDAIKNAFWRLQRATGINGGRGFYTLRKTGASEIERIDPLVTSLYLAHSPREMKRFYALRNWDALDKALDALGARLSPYMAL